ncbi:crossover junction endodeoxyribonuclease RuvC [candidate division WOR-3 bacterium]|uniref:Crossover junction endodeoxyribonuclease RuvC n=1 Tax=candidate division WOR-3 bacterium TaxID=2052148 RepID=A0A660SHE9_UNCW3|nr:MAG: crossover junction endodeoxyribonuclease RuvC [candidate division WOR-3 bacterium]
MKFLGIDPGLVSTGYAFINEEGILSSGVIKEEGTTAERIYAITSRLKRLVVQHRPDRAGIETAFYGRNPQSLIKSAQLIGAISYLLMDLGIETIEFHPTVLKRMITGKGRASKSQVSYMVKKLLQIDTDLFPDEADALAVALATRFYHDRRD